MRKISILITSLFLTIIFAFSGCSCDNTMPLSFKDSFLGTNSSSFYKEVLRYKVTYKENYNDAIVKNDNFSDKYGFTYDEGEYVTTLTRYDNLEKAIADDDNKETISKSDVASVFPANDSYVYKLTASFSIPVTYKNCYFLEESKATPEKQVIDTINSTIYFGGKSISFAPIFSYTSSNYSTLNCFSDEYAVIGNVTSKSSVLYNKGNYKITNNTTEDVVESSYDYSLSTVVDNNQLLFALRNFEVDGSALGYLPTVSPAYGESKYLTIENESEYTLENISIKFNDHTITGNMPVKRYSYKLSDTTTTGFKQYLTIQREPVEGQSSPFEYRSLLTEYASPLISYGSISVMGALVYTLSSVQYS